MSNQTKTEADNSGAQAAPAPAPAALQPAAPGPAPAAPGPQSAVPQLATSFTPAPLSRGYKVFLIVYITLLQMFTMFSTDLYTPALPGMTVYFQTSESIVNLTLVVFFVFQLLGMLVFGPVSDRYGRKPILLIGASAYILTSLGCTLAQNIGVLIGFRALQAFAVGAATSMATALVKDCFIGRTRENVLVLVQAVFILGPIIAPVIGAQTLQFFSWRASFAILVLLGMVVFVLTLFFRESLPISERLTGSFFASFRGLAVVAKNRDFMLFLLVTTIFVSLPFLAYLSVAAFIYESFFGLSALEYSYYFAAAAGCSVVGLLLYKLIERRITIRALTTALLIGTVLCGLGMLLFGHSSAFVFFLMMMVYQAIEMMARPYSVNTLFDLQKDDTGSASSMMNCSYTVVGLIGVLPVVALAGDYITSLAVLLLLGFAFSLVFWLVLQRRGRMNLSVTCTPPR
ncbi:MAG: MFS transporter [Coriobacteriales bacterium]|jgi:DHA1 family bicyclomycin/chloramphenicol resistance-like MFS transporter|nr:MFS transporter [Coriobacteriales bacterium]